MTYLTTVTTETYIDKKSFKPYKLLKIEFDIPLETYQTLRDLKGIDINDKILNDLMEDIKWSILNNVG